MDFDFVKKNDLSFTILNYINHPDFCKAYSKARRLIHGAPYLLCLFQIEESVSLKSFGNGTSSFISSTISSKPWSISFYSC
jgi:hypothetical protein